MLQSTVRILLIDDDEEDFFITEDLLSDAPGEFDLTWRLTYVEGLDTLGQENFDVCLVDYRIGGETGLEFLETAKTNGIECPMILLTGVGQRDVDIAAGEVGAADYLDKQSLTPTLLERAIRYAILHSRALRDLAHQRNVLETTLESLQGGIVAFDAEGTVLAQNSRFPEMIRNVGYSVEKGQACELLPIEAARDLVSASGSEGVGMVEIEGDDGRFIELRVGPVPGGGQVLLAVDITAQKTLQRKMMEAKAAAELANRTKSAFLAKISHELRTPLNGVFGMAQILTLSGLDDIQKGHVDRLLDSAQSLMALIEDLLDISIIEEGRFSLHEAEIDAPALLSEAAAIAQAASRHAAPDIEVVIGLTPGEVLVADRKRIKQVLVNFLNNASKFAPGGNITLSVRQIAPGEVRFSVKDDGPGVPIEEQARIFDRFTQADAEVSRLYGGVGLGLSIAKELVEQMGGRIGLTSIPGDGAEFWFDLPTAPGTSLGAVDDDSGFALGSA